MKLVTLAFISIALTYLYDISKNTLETLGGAKTAKAEKENK